MSTRRVRGETGAVFDVDASMLDDAPRREPGYREASALPRASEINRAPPRSRVPAFLTVVFVAELAVFFLALAAR